MAAGIAQLKGSIPPLITPFRDSDVDLNGYAGLVNFQVEEGFRWSRQRAPSPLRRHRL